MDYKIAKDFATRLFNEKLKGMERKFILKHCEEVERVSLRLAKYKKADINILKIASWLHDIGRTISVKGHSTLSLEIAEKEFVELDSRLKDAILNHGDDKFPETNEGKIIQFADKVSILDYETLEFVFINSDNIKENLSMYDYVTKDFLELLKRYSWKE